MGTAEIGFTDVLRVSVHLNYTQYFKLLNLEVLLHYCECVGKYFVIYALRMIFFFLVFYSECLSAIEFFERGIFALFNFRLNKGNYISSKKWLQKTDLFLFLSSLTSSTDYYYQSSTGII